MSKKKSERYKKPAEELSELAETYTQTDPDLLRQAYAKREISYETRRRQTAVC